MMFLLTGTLVVLFGGPLLLGRLERRIGGGR